MSAITTASPIAALLDADAYKLDHRRQYPEGITRVFSNWTNRSTRIPDVNRVVHFGLQALLQDALVESFAPFFAADEDEVARLYEEAVESIVGPNEVGSDHIRALHRIGFLPLRFSAVPEGTIVPIGVPSFIIENTRPEQFWLVNYVETLISSEYWQAATTATIANTFRGILEEGAERTGGDQAAVDFQLHDFSFRGMAGRAAAAKSGAAHLLSFKGSDSLGALDFVRRYYPGKNGQVLASIPATEHSVMCAGTPDGGDETAQFEHLLDLYPSGMFSVVSDTYDLWAVLTGVLPSLRDRILGRDGRVVIRPDSGDPVDILAGTTQGFLPAHERARLSPSERGVIELLWDTFGGTINDAGFRVLDPHVGAIYGDSITMDRARQIIARLEAKGYASTNVVFGVGSYTYQYQTRDTFGSAIKATWVERNGAGIPIRKDPITDNGGKRSAFGRLAVLADERGELVLHQDVDAETEARSLLQPVWEDGDFIQRQTFAEVREVLAAETKRVQAINAAA